MTDIQITRFEQSHVQAVAQIEQACFADPWTEDGLQVVQLITDDHTAVRLYLDGTVPQCAELSVDERSCLYCTVEQWNLEQGSTNDESQNSNMGRDQSQ